MEHLTSDERELLAKARAATPGSWEWMRPTGSREGGFIQHNQDLDFIASANPATVVKLLEELDQARGEAKRLFFETGKAAKGQVTA